MRCSELNSAPKLSCPCLLQCLFPNIEIGLIRLSPGVDYLDTLRIAAVTRLLLVPLSSWA